MQNEITYQVQGSSPEPYTVKITLSPLSLSCTCTAAENGLPCKHRLKIMAGDDPGIVKGDKARLADIAAAVKNTDAFNLYAEYETARAAANNLDKVASRAFKKYADARVALLENQVKTDRTVVKARAEMEAVIDSIPLADKETQKALKKLGAILV